MSIFVDTSAFYALLDAGDPAHTSASSVMRRIAGHEELLTHAYVVSESLALTQRRLGSNAVRALAEELLPLVTTLFVDEPTHDAALAALLAGPSARVSFVDLVSFQVMREFSITKAFAFDRDFGNAGFQTLP